MSQADEDEVPLPPEQEAALLAALEAALRPSELSAAVNERLIELALEDPLAPASEQELAESARLRDALQGGRDHEDAATLAALRHAFQEPVEAERELERAVERALGAAAPRPATPARRRNVVYAVFGAASAALAAAAVAVLFVGSVTQRASESELATYDSPAFVKPRSTAPLFNEPFETAGTTARMDAIAGARSRDLRDNRYAAWGVR